LKDSLRGFLQAMWESSLAIFSPRCSQMLQIPECSKWSLCSCIQPSRRFPRPAPLIGALRRYVIVGLDTLDNFGLTPVPRLSARLPILFNVASKARNSFRLASANNFLISAACLRKIGAINSLPFAVSDTTRTRRSSGLSIRLTRPLSTRRSTAVLIEPGVRWTFGPIVFTGKGPLLRSTSSIRKSVSSIPVSSSPA
jgi:hypothetical protein